MRFSKTFIVVIGCVVAFTLAGCGGARTDNSSSDQATATSTSQTQEATSGSEQGSTSSETTSSAISAIGEAAKNIQGSATDLETKRVGKEGIGFIDIPANYIDFVDVEPNTDLQYSDVLGKDIFTLNIVDLSGLSEEDRAAFTLETGASNLWAKIESEGATDVGGAHVTLLGRDAVQVYGTYPDGVILVMVLVQDDAGVIHYISAESDNIDTLNMMVTQIEKSYAFDA